MPLQSDTDSIESTFNGKAGYTKNEEIVRNLGQIIDESMQCATYFPAPVSAHRIVIGFSRTVLSKLSRNVNIGSADRI